MPEAHQENQQDETKSSEVTYDRVDPDPATRAEAAGNAPEDWIDAPPRTEFDASCPECGSVTPHKMPDRSPFPGGFSVPTTHERADELKDQA